MQWINHDAPPEYDIENVTVTGSRGSGAGLASLIAGLNGGIGRGTGTEGGGGGGSAPGLNIIEEVVTTASRITAALIMPGLAAAADSQPQGEQPDPKPTEPPCPDGPSYMDRYVDWTSDHVINVGPYAAALAGGVWPKSWAPATGGRPPLLGSGNPLTSVPRAFGFPGAGSAVARTGAAGIGLLTVGIGFYDLTIELEGFLYAIPDYGAGSCKKPN